MPSKESIERNIRIVSRKCYKQIRYFKMPLFAILILIFTLLMLSNPTSEKVAMFTLSMVAIGCATLKNKQMKEEKRKAREKHFTSQL